jgi:hypothetical protein
MKCRCSSRWKLRYEVLPRSRKAYRVASASAASEVTAVVDACFVVKDSTEQFDRCAFNQERMIYLGSEPLFSVSYLGPAQSLWRSSVQAAQLTALGLRAFVHPRRTCLSSSRDCQLGARPSGWVASAVVKQPTQFPKPPTVTPNFARRFDVTSIVDSGCGFG